MRRTDLKAGGLYNMHWGETAVLLETDYLWRATYADRHETRFVRTFARNPRRVSGGVISRVDVGWLVLATTPNNASKLPRLASPADVVDDDGRASDLPTGCRLVVVTNVRDFKSPAEVTA